jgi:hypothetical protein
VTCGGCYNFVTGAYKRAPDWMQASGLEWLFRLAKEPKRLFWRYAVTNPLAIFLLLTRTFSPAAKPPVLRVDASVEGFSMTAAPAIFDARTARPAKSATAGASASPRRGAIPCRHRARWRPRASHFLISFVFMREMFAHQFGLFSFVLVIVPFCMSLIAAALSLPITRSLDKVRQFPTRPSSPPR